MVDPNAPVPGTLGGHQGEPVVLVVLCGREQRAALPRPKSPIARRTARGEEAAAAATGRAGRPPRPAHRAAPPAGTPGSTAAAPRRYRRRPAGGG